MSMLTLLAGGTARAAATPTGAGATKGADGFVAAMHDAVTQLSALTGEAAPTGVPADATDADAAGLPLEPPTSVAPSPAPATPDARTWATGLLGVALGASAEQAGADATAQATPPADATTSEPAADPATAHPAAAATTPAPMAMPASVATTAPGAAAADSAPTGRAVSVTAAPATLAAAATANTAPSARPAAGSAERTPAAPTAAGTAGPQASAPATATADPTQPAEGLDATPAPRRGGAPAPTPQDTPDAAPAATGASALPAPAALPTTAVAPKATPAGADSSAAASVAAASAPSAPAAPQAAAPAVPAAPAPAPTPVPQDFAAQLAKPIANLRTAGGGEHIVTVSVTPENLGPVTVRAHVGADGMRIELVAPSDAGREALKSIMTELRRDLAALGVTTQSLTSGGNQSGQQGGNATLDLAGQGNTGTRDGAGDRDIPNGAARATDRLERQPAGEEPGAALPATGIDILA